MKTFCEFFAGVGLFREGLESYGWKCQWANDISLDKKQVYLDNYGSEHFWLGDIWDVLSTESKLPRSSFLYTASFPCTDLSVAGNRAGLAGEESGTLGALFEILKHKKNEDNLPKVVLLENVKGFLTSHQGQDVTDTVALFSGLGYYVDIVELDAINFTPQSRPRVFVIAVCEEIASRVMHLKDSVTDDFWWACYDKTPMLKSNKLKNIIKSSPTLNWALFPLCEPTPTDKRLIDIVEKIPNDSDLWWNDTRREHLHKQMSDLHLSELEKMVNSNTLSYGTVYRRMRKGRSMAELRTDGFAGCLRTPRGGSSKQIIIEAGKGEWRVRLLTPREYARLQGLRDSFILPDNANKGYFAMGDAVCVPVIEYIAREILEPVYEAMKQHRSAA
ncbi:TPA: DNA cytosine methyltransferase [Vibrio parahaemolyticus]|uniref:DNA cytosine methyltransferase n=1 Tax=Vibrio parahaemolyticus TaxID=670 RepID=UPI0004DB6FA4|nr:DNA (cytosine-5-)-methyltransferase [Vibrio parahaemolyticus]MDF4642281.1 DNA (cytosine-5-)-methyltransferase [Vibrio parahaemolyticus]